MSTVFRLCPGCQEAIERHDAHPGGEDIFVGQGELSDTDLLSCDCVCHPATAAQMAELGPTYVPQPGDIVLSKVNGKAYAVVTVLGFESELRPLDGSGQHGKNRVMANDSLLWVPGVVEK